MVIAHLAVLLRQTHNITVPIVWVRVEPIKNPDCVAVRDEFFRRFDHPYHEQEVWCWEDSNGWHASGTLQNGFHDAEKALSMKRSLRGIRGAESGTRKHLMERSGQCSKNSCRPIGYWSGQDVFAYLHVFDLPIHPAYAMSMGGILDRDRIRVSSIGGTRGGGMGRDAWEAKYYGDELAMVLNNKDLVDQLT
jgi:phosphoadenosine phosphosulfate reductase